MGMVCIGQGIYPTWVWSVLVGYSPNMGMEFTGRVLTQHGYGVYWSGYSPNMRL